MKAFFDIETDGLEATRVHCICAMLDNDETTVYNFIGGEANGLFRKWLASENVDTLVGHNIINFDVPILRRITGMDWSFNLRDTLVLSRLYNPSLDGGHSLRAWGERLGDYKDDYQGGWEEYSHDMLEYCQQDVRVTKALYNHFVKHLTFSEAVNLEHTTAEIIKQQTDNGMILNEERAYELLAEMKEKVLDIEDEVHERFKPLPVWVDLVHPKDKMKNKDGSISKRYQAQLDKGAHFYDELDAEGDPAIASCEVKQCAWGYFEYPEFNLGSRQQIAKYLQHFGWKPKAFTEKGNPIVDEKVLKSVNIPEAQLIVDYLTLTKRIAMVKSWVDAIDERTGRVHGRVNPCGAVTGRMTHSNPNCAQVPATRHGKDGKILWGFEGGYGADCRDLWTVPEDYKLVGCDASGLELRMLAHYMNDDKYTNEILNGDIHSANQKSAGLQTRDQAKTFIYAFLYGAGDSKIGEVAGGGAKRGRILKKNFLDNTPALKQLREKVSESSGKGWVTGLDGRKLHIRSQHSALNTLLQSAGAVVMKKALVLLDSYARQYDLDYKFVLNVHDEFQCEVRQDQADFFGGLAVGSIIQAGKSFKLNCPLDGEYKVGETWQQTH
jgi:DNA polymerase I-like protein with 3'-5' exonuclease and polymerase domains